MTALAAGATGPRAGGLVSDEEEAGSLMSGVDRSCGWVIKYKNRRKPNMTYSDYGNSP